MAADGGVSGGGDTGGSGSATGSATASGDTSATPAEANPGLSLKTVSVDTPSPSDIYVFDGPSSNATPSKAVKRRSRAWRYLCHKCGEEDLHWVIDSLVGVLLSAAFAVACAVLLTTTASNEM